MIFDLITQFWYLWAFFAGFFLIHKKRKPNEPKKNILVIGHQGACGYAEGNSKKSIEQALRIGVDMVEEDLRITKDGVFVLSHNEKVKTISGKKIRISKANFTELENAKLKSKENIISLDELRKILPSDQAILIDLKIKGQEFNLVNYLDKHDLTGKVWISSSYASSLRLIKIVNPNLTVGLSFPRDRLPIFAYLMLSPILAPLVIILKHTYPFYVGLLAGYAKADFIAVSFRFMLTSRLVKAAHKRNLLVFPFTVNSPKNIRKMIKMNVDAIVSDYPDRVKEMLKYE